MSQYDPDTMVVFRVRPVAGGEAYRLGVEPRDMYIWESTGRGRSAADLDKGIPAVAAYQLAHIVAKRLDKNSQSLEEFAATHNVTAEEVPELEPDPTNPAP